MPVSVLRKGVGGTGFRSGCEVAWWVRVLLVLPDYRMPYGSWGLTVWGPVCTCMTVCLRG